MTQNSIKSLKRCLLKLSLKLIKFALTVFQVLIREQEKGRRKLRLHKWMEIIKTKTINDIWMGKGAVGTCSKKEISCLCLLMLCFLDCSYSVFKRVKAN